MSAEQIGNLVVAVEAVVVQGLNFLRTAQLPESLIAPEAVALEIVYEGICGLICTMNSMIAMTPLKLRNRWFWVTK